MIPWTESAWNTAEAHCKIAESGRISDNWSLLCAAAKTKTAVASYCLVASHYEQEGGAISGKPQDVGVISMW